VDGWLKLINQHQSFDGMEFDDAFDDKGSLVSVTCKMYRKDRSHPTVVTEYMSECVRATDTWRKWPARMLRHKATIQAARYSFGFAGIMEPDEAERMADRAPVQTDNFPALQIADKRKARCHEAYEQYGQSVDVIKEFIKKYDETEEPDHLITVAETWGDIPSAAQMDLWLAPTKGGVFTTHERDIIKTKLPRD
jgi:hypothetical protein